MTIGPSGFLGVGDASTVTIKAVTFELGGVESLVKTAPRELALNCPEGIFSPLTTAQS